MEIEATIKQKEQRWVNELKKAGFLTNFNGRQFWRLFQQISATTNARANIRISIQTQWLTALIALEKTWCISFFGWLIVDWARRMMPSSTKMNTIFIAIELNELWSNSDRSILFRWWGLAHLVGSLAPRGGARLVLGERLELWLERLEVLTWLELLPIWKKSSNRQHWLAVPKDLLIYWIDFWLFGRAI